MVETREDGARLSVMSLLPDPDALLAVADRITGHAAAIRAHAHALGWSVGHSTWHGPAARTFAGHALEVCAALRRSADRLDAAAASLRRHAATVRAALTVLRQEGRALVAAAVGVGDGALHGGASVLHSAGRALDAVRL